MLPVMMRAGNLTSHISRFALRRDKSTQKIMLPTAAIPAVNQQTMVLSIAGSDPSGGAGIQADLKTFCVIGVYGGAAITCLTSQNTQGVFSYLPVEPLFVQEQIVRVLQDLPVSHVKIGMVGTAAIAQHIGRALQGFAGEIVCDPVLTATAGLPLLQDEAFSVYREEILGRATVLTPNLQELATLADRNCNGTDEELAAGRLLLERFPRLRCVIIKGGHRPGDALVTDSLLVRRTGSEVEIVSQEHPRIATVNTHGTGCTFASAFTAYHLLNNDYVAAFRKAVFFMDALLTRSAPFRLGNGAGPLSHHLAD